MKKNFSHCKASIVSQYNCSQSFSTCNWLTLKRIINDKILLWLKLCKSCQLHFLKMATLYILLIIIIIIIMRISLLPLYFKTHSLRRDAQFWNVRQIKAHWMHFLVGVNNSEWSRSWHFVTPFKIQDSRFRKKCIRQM